MFKKLKTYLENKKNYNVLSEDHRANDLLNNDGFNIAVQKLMLEQCTSIVNTSPDEKEKREDLYRQYHLIQGLVFNLKQMANSVKNAENIENIGNTEKE